MAWQLEGDYFENCNCDILCPCITSSMQAPADNERCYVPLICHVNRGSFDDVSLDDLNFILVVDTPAVMAEGGWRVAVYIDERADDDQRQAFGAILSGDHGGPPEMLKGLIGEQLGVKFVPIEYSSSNGRRCVDVPGIMSIEVEGITLPISDDVGRSPTSSIRWAPTSRSVGASAVSTTIPTTTYPSTIPGRNGHYREFSWQGG